jgi:hypothetical protein
MYVPKEACEHSTAGHFTEDKRWVWSARELLHIICYGLWFGDDMKQALQQSVMVLPTSLVATDWWYPSSKLIEQNLLLCSIFDILELSANVAAAKYMQCCIKKILRFIVKYQQLYQVNWKLDIGCPVPQSLIQVAWYWSTSHSNVSDVKILISQIMLNTGCIYFIAFLVQKGLCGYESRPACWAQQLPFAVEIQDEAWVGKFSITRSI